MSQGSVLSCTYNNIYIYEYIALETTGVYLGLFADDTCLYPIDRKEGFVIRNCSAVSAQWRRDMSAGISKLRRKRLRGFTSLLGLDRLSAILLWMDGTFCL
jgi:hypothetical protein